MIVRSDTRCLLCNQSTSSVLIWTGNEKSEELSELFEVFCDYLKLDPDRKLRNAFPGRLFPFCNACSINVHQLFDYHKEKVRVLEKLSQVVVSMAVLILESDESDGDSESSHNVGADPVAEVLVGQITALRKCVVQNYRPKLHLKSVKPYAIEPVKVEACSLAQNDKIPSKQGINKVSADVRSENILDTSLDRRSKRSKAKCFQKIETKNNILHSDAGFGAGEARYDSMDVDYYGNDGDSDDLKSNNSEESDDFMSQSSGDDRNLRPRTKSRVTPRGTKRRSRTYAVKIDEDTYSFGNYKYTVNGSEFNCETCPYTAKSFKRIRLHLREQHILHVPLIPEKPMDEYKVRKNKYVLADKHSFKKVGEKEFRCSTCKQTATTWSKMYTHIRELHFSPTRRRGQVAPLFRPKGVVVPLGDNEFEYFGFKYSVLPHGSHTCLTCGALGVTLNTMQGHIRKSHADFLPEVPDKSLEDFEIHPNLFCLSRRYMFERTRDNCFECSFSDCNLVTPTWEEMYIHIRADHYFLLERSQKRQRQARRSEQAKGSSASLASNPQQKVVKGKKAVGNVDKAASKTEFDQDEADFWTSASDPTRKKTRNKSIPAADGSLPGVQGETPIPQTQSENYNSDSDADFGVGEPQDDSIDLDYENDGDSDDLKSTKSEESDDSTSESSGDEGNLRPRTKLRVTTTVRKKRCRTFQVQIDENTYSFGNYRYTSHGSEFKCETCSFTAFSLKRILTHLRELHTLNVPPIPEKPMDEYKVCKNEYILGDKHSFQKVGEKEFRCSTCKQTATTWSKMYNHIRERHFATAGNKTVGLTGDPLPFIRPRALVTPSSDNEFECLSFKFSVLPHGSHKCLTCGFISDTQRRIVLHIKQMHADFLPEVPNKSLEDFEIHPNLFCLSRRYMFERTGDGSFDCSLSGCNVETPSWEEMYAHIRTDHYYPLERLAKNPRRKSLASSASQDLQQEIPAQENDEAHDESSSNPDPTRKEAEGETHLPEAAGLSLPKSAGEVGALNPGTQTSTQNFLLSKKSASPTRNAWKASQVLADIEISPGRYSYNDFEFHRSEDGKFICDSCDTSLSPESKHSIFTHIRAVHMKSDGLRKTGPNEFLLRGTYPAIRDEAGKFRCRVEGCESRTGFATLNLLKVHVQQRHVKAKSSNRPAVSLEDKRDKLRREQEETQRALSKFQVGPNQYNYRGIDFEFRGDVYHCGSCGFETRIRIVFHIMDKHVERDSADNPKRKTPARGERLSFEEVSPDEFLIAGEFRAYRLPEGTFKCGVDGCDSISGTKNNLVRHVRERHKWRPVICELCGKVYTNKLQLAYHQANQHEDGEEQKCPQCGKVLRNPFLLKRHLQWHKAKAVPKPLHVCHSCGKAYTNTGGLKNHMRTHHSEFKPTFVCEQCGRVYSNIETLRLHMRVEHLGGGEKTHPCHICQKQFKYKETVRRHILVVHEGKKSSEVYKRKQKPGSSAGTSAGSRRKKRERTEAAETDAGSSMDADTADEDDSMDFQKLIDF